MAASLRVNAIACYLTCVMCKPGQLTGHVRRLCSCMQCIYIIEYFYYSHLKQTTQLVGVLACFDVDAKLTSLVWHFTSVHVPVISSWRKLFISVPSTHFSGVSCLAYAVLVVANE